MKGSIRWRQSDYITLGKAISDFNKKINELQKNETITYLPELKNYKEIKKGIKTRNELRRQINSLKRFKIEGAEDLKITDAGQEITKWEYRELGILKAQATRKLNAEIELIKDTGKGKFGNLEKTDIKATLNSFKKINKTKGYEFLKIKERLEYYGSSDYLYRKNYIFKENYLKMLSNFKNYDNYEEFRKIIENTPANELYKKLTKSDVGTDTLSDIQYMYDVNGGVVVSKGFTSQNIFDNLYSKLKKGNRNDT